LNLIVKLLRRLYGRHIQKTAMLNSKVISTALLHNKTFLPLKNICNGKKVVMCGAGPTLSKYVPIEDAIHVALNRAFLFDKVLFDYIIAQDFDGLKHVQRELIDYRGNNCIKLLGALNVKSQKEIPESLAIKCGALRYNTDMFMLSSGYRSEFTCDLSSVAVGNCPNVSLSALQIILYMNPDSIYIVGCDISGSHFSQKNLDKNSIDAENIKMKKLWSKSQGKLIRKWKEFKHFQKTYYPDTKIYSINPVGLKGLFEDIYQP
jgi:hypothetical protein